MNTLRRWLIFTFLLAAAGVTGQSGFMSAAQAARNEVMYDVGRLVSYGRACHLHGLTSDLSRRLKGDRDFKAGMHDADLGGWDMVRGLRCGKIEETLVMVQKHLDSGGDMQDPGPRTYTNGQTGADRRSLDPQLADIAPPRSSSGATLQIATNTTTVKKARAATLSQYEDHAQKWAFDYDAAKDHKAVAVCVAWSIVHGAILPNQNEAPRPRVMESFWQSGAKDRATAIVDSMAQCQAWRQSNSDKRCHCQQLKADEDVVLQVPAG